MENFAFLPLTWAASGRHVKNSKIEINCITSYVLNIGFEVLSVALLTIRDDHKNQTFSTHFYFYMLRQNCSSLRF